MDLVIDTDVGHDADDFFAICYLASLPDVAIKAITVTPGDRDQIAVANLLVKELIGPCSNVGKFLQRQSMPFNRVTMQGGFLGYRYYTPQVRLPQFEGKTWVPTFNMNGDRKGAEALMTASFKERRFVGKNVCHTILFNKEQYIQMAPPVTRAAELFMEAAQLYLLKHEEKKFHDPTAAVCHMHPEIGTWVHGKVKKIESGWGTIPDEEGDYVLADIDRERLWEYLRNWR